MAWQQLVIKVSPDTHRQVTRIKQILEDRKQRQVTYNEVLDELAATWRLLDKANAKAREATQ